MRIVIGDDSGLFRDGLARLLVDAGHEVVAAVGDAVAASSAVQHERPDLVVLDIRMPPGMDDDGARLAADLRLQSPTLALMLLSQHVDTRHIIPLVTHGSFGYLLKDRVLAFDEFLTAIERVASGGTALDPEVVSRLLDARTSQGRLDVLSPRERDVLALMAEGHTNIGIAHRLYLTDRTIESHIGSIFTKLGIEASEAWNRRVLAVIAYLDAANR